jgi:hypothetical protein
MWKVNQKLLDGGGWLIIHLKDRKKIRNENVPSKLVQIF